MKYILSFSSICLLLLSACKRDYKGIAGYSPLDSSMAYLKIVHASPNFRQVFNTRDTFNVFVGGQKINATALTYNGIWPLSVNSSTTSITATYAAVAAGQSQVRLSVPGATNPDSATILTLTKSLMPGRFYTLLVTDSVQLNADSSRIFIQDNIPMTLPGFINLRFVNAVMNDTTGKNVDVVSYARNANLFSNYKPGTASPFALLNFNQSVIDTLYVTRPAASGTPISQRIVLAKLPLNASVLGSGAQDRRSFTLYYKGDGNLASGTKARSLSVYINR
jgi:hypothetical protein